MSAFISDTTLMAIIEFMRSRTLTREESYAVEECIQGLSGVGIANQQKPIDPELAKHSSEVVDELLKADHIPDATKKVETPEDQAIKNQPAVDLLTEWIQRPATEKEREAWEAFEKLVEESEPDETPEEGAKLYCDQFSWHDPREEDAHEAFLAGVRWAEGRNKK